jgi:ABC-2 type transport system ATP-binding protein
LDEQLIKKILVSTANNPSALNYLLQSNRKAALNKNNEIEITDSDAIKHPEKITKFLTEKNLPPKLIYLFTEDLEMYFLRTIRN